MSEFQFIDNGAPISTAGVTVTNPGGNTPGAEGPENIIDGNTGTKWLDFTKFSPLVFQFPAPVTIDAYTFATANDDPERDPVSWTFEGSVNGTTWTLIDQKTNYATTVARQTYQNLGSGLPSVFFVGDAPKLILGQPLVLIWVVSDSTSVTIDNGIGSVGASGTVTVNPVVNTTYTLTATGPGGAASATFSTEIINPPITVINYPNFNAAGDELALLNNASIVNDFANIPLPGNFDRLRLTADQMDRKGTVWFRKRIDFSTGFVSSFDFQINTFSANPGADGMAFIIQNNPNGTAATPPGFEENGLRSAALNIKFDSYNEGALEVSDAYVQIRSGTTVLATSNLLDFPALVPFPGTDPNDLTTNGGTAAPYRVRVEYVPGDLDVYFNDVLVVDSVDVDLVATGAVDAAGKGYVGFSSRTGFYTESHDVTRWILTEGPATVPLVLKSHSFDFVTDQVTLTWESENTKTYRITTSPDLVFWSPLTTGIPGAAIKTAATVNFVQGTKAFFRVEEE